jgi:hypothetical protein
MSNLQERLIESMIKDLENIKRFDEGKILRKECSLLIKRVESAKKLFSAEDELLSKLQKIELEIRSINT